MWKSYDSGKGVVYRSAQMKLRGVPGLWVVSSKNARLHLLGQGLPDHTLNGDHRASVESEQSSSFGEAQGMPTLGMWALLLAQLKEVTYQLSEVTKAIKSASKDI